MGITYGDHLVDSGYYDITPEQEREIEAREECERLSNELDPEIGFPSDDLLRRIHLDIETRGRKNQAFAVSVHHRNIVLSAVARALRNRDLSWEGWLMACGWPSGSGTCECYRPGDCDGSCTHPPLSEKSIQISDGAE